MSFACRDRHELENWAARLDQLAIPHGGIVDADYGSGVSFRDPDGISLEFYPAGLTHRPIGKGERADARSRESRHPERHFRGDAALAQARPAR